MKLLALGTILFAGVSCFRKSDETHLEKHYQNMRRSDESWSECCKRLRGN